jgi:hypothetical protein
VWFLYPDSSQSCDSWSNILSEIVGSSIRLHQLE